MRISDWSSDVCSSDLCADRRHCCGDEHHRVAPQLARDRTSAWKASVYGTWMSLLRRIRPQKVWPAIISRCSTIGPSASAGKKVRPPTIRMVPARKATNIGPWVGKLPTEAGVAFLAARRSEEHTSELQSLMRTSYAVFCLIKTTYTHK